MTDEFNLVPTNNLEKHLDNILRAASGDEPQYDLAPNWRVEQYLAAIAAKLPGGGGLPPVTASDNGKVLTGDNGEWTPMGQLQSANNITIKANVEQDGSFSTVGTINYVGAQYLYNRGCLFVNIYRNDSLEQVVKCDFATDIADGLFWVFRGNYFDTLSDNPKTIAVSFQPPHSSDADPASITITNIDANNKFIVTLTPTAEDYSGTMDKTVAEINAAYEAGQEILFDVRVAGNVTLRSTMTEVYIDTGYDFPSFQVNVMVDSATLMKAYTGITDDGTKQTYQTMVYGV